MEQHPGSEASVRAGARGVIGHATRHVPRTVAMLILLVLVWVAIAGGLRQLPHSHTIGQRVETAVQLASGLLGLLVVLARLRWRRWARSAGFAWAATLGLAAGLSPLVWGPSMPFMALLFAAAALFLALTILRVLE